jgi:hypothetical protein
MRKIKTPADPSKIGRPIWRRSSFTRMRRIICPSSHIGAHSRIVRKEVKRRSCEQKAGDVQPMMSEDSGERTPIVAKLRQTPREGTLWVGAGAQEFSELFDRGAGVPWGIVRIPPARSGRGKSVKDTAHGLLICPREIGEMVGILGRRPAQRPYESFAKGRRGET